MPIGCPSRWREPGDQRVAVLGLELGELAAVDEPGDDLVHVVRLLHVDRDDCRERRRVDRRRAGLAHRPGPLGRHGQRRHHVAHELEGVLVVVGEVVGDTRHPRVQVAAAELLGGDDLADRRLHEGRAAEEDGALVAHDHRLVAHRRHVRAAGRARAEDRGQLRDAHRRQLRLVVEDPPEVLAVGEHLVLLRQEGATRVDEVDARQPVLLRDLLGAEVLLHRHRVVRAALDRGVVADDHDRPALHEADARDDARTRRVAVVESLRGERRQLEERAALVEQPVDPVAWQQLSAGDMAFTRALGPAECGGGEPVAQLLHQLGVLGGVASPRLARWVDARREGRHPLRPSSSTARPLVSGTPFRLVCTNSIPRC